MHVCVQTGIWIDIFGAVMLCAYKMNFFALLGELEHMFYCMVSYSSWRRKNIPIPSLWYI